MARITIAFRFIIIFDIRSGCGGVILLKLGPGLVLGFSALYFTFLDLIMPV